MAQTVTSEVLDVREAADFLRCSTSFIHREALAGNIPSYRLGNEYRFLRGDLIHWLRGQTAPRGRRASTPASTRAVPVHTPPPAPAEASTPVPAPVTTSPSTPIAAEASLPPEGAGPYYDPGLDLGNPPPPLGHKPYLTPEQRQERMTWIVTAILRGKALGEAGEVAGIASRATVHRWRQEVPEFDRAIREAQQRARVLR